MGGNRITLIRLVIPVADPDPSVRIPAIGRLCRAAREERCVAFTNAIAGTLNLLPPAVVGQRRPRVHLPRVSRRCATRAIRGLRSHDGRLYQRDVALLPRDLLGRVTTDSAAVPDPDVLIECLREGFEEVLDLAGDHHPALLPLQKTAAAAP